MDYFGKQTFILPSMNTNNVTMNNRFLVLAAACIMALGAITISGCGNSQGEKEQPAAEATHAHEHEHAAVYQCPMKCEGDKTYTEAGNCPKCGMSLEAVEHDHGHEGHSH